MHDESSENALFHGNSSVYWKTSSPLKAFLVNYTYFAYPIVGLAGIFLGALYGVVTMKMTAYEKEKETIDDKIASAKVAGQRPMIQRGNECALCYLVDKPSLEGARGTIECDGPDGSGYITVLVQGREIKVEEFQLTVVASPEEFEKRRTMASLRAAEQLDKYENRGESLARLQKIYVTLGQGMVGLLVMGILFLLTTGRFNAITVFREIVRQATKNQGNLLKYQAKYCSKWSRCFDLGGTRPEFCGSCALTRPKEFPEDILRRKSFTGGNIISGSSLTSLITFAAAGGAGGLVLGIVFMGVIARVKLRITIFVTCLLTVLFAGIAAAACSIPYELADFLPLDADQCSAADIAKSTPGIQPVGEVCILTVAAYEVKEKFEEDARLSVTGCLINMFFFLNESLGALSLAIRARGPNDWAKFEALVFLYYFILVAVTMLGSNTIYTYTEWFVFVNDIFRDITLFGANSLDIFGAGFPLALDQQWVFNRQNQMGHGLWFKFDLAAPLFATVIVIQVIAICIAMGTSREVVWVRSIRFVLILDMLIIFTIYVSIAYFSLSSVNAVHNVLAVSVIPLCVQFLFAMLYSIQSDIIPIFANIPENPVLAGFVRAGWLAPPIALVILMIGFAYYSFYANAPSDIAGTPPMQPSAYTGTGYSLMLTAGLTLFLYAAALAVAFVRTMGMYAEDWQMMIVYEVTHRFGWELPEKFKPKEVKTRSHLDGIGAGGIDLETAAKTANEAELEADLRT